MIKGLIVFSLFAYAVWGQCPVAASGSTVANAAINPRACKYFGTAAPGSVTGNLSGDFYTDTTNHNEYVCNAPSGTAAPACTSVTAAGWLRIIINPIAAADLPAALANSTSVNGTAIPELPTTFNCGSYVNLNACLDAAKTYVTTNEAGSGKAARVMLPQGTLSITPAVAAISLTAVGNASSGATAYTGIGVCFRWHLR